MTTVDLKSKRFGERQNGPTFSHRALCLLHEDVFSFEEGIELADSNHMVDGGVVRADASWRGEQCQPRKS